MVFAYGLLFALLTAVAAQTADAPEPSAPDTTLRASAVYADAQAHASAACVKLVRSEPFPPDESPLPKYPEAARTASVEGDVSFHLEVGSGCATEEIKIDEGPEMLQEAVANAVKDWKYCGVPEGQEIRASIAFRLNCPAK
jgi:outer membrane biosynthesis protein TonB